MSAPSDHVVQLFDSVESLGEAVGRFLADGIERGERALCLAKPSHVQAIAEVLARRGHSLSSLIDSRQFLVLDAATTLRLITRGGVPDTHVMNELVENTISHLVPGDARLCIYGELVEVLAEEGNFHAAEQLECFWNDFGETHSMSLMCGYSSAHFVMPGALSALSEICALHGKVDQSRRDLLANWLLSRCEDSPTAASTR